MKKAILSIVVVAVAGIVVCAVAKANGVDFVQVEDTPEEKFVEE